LDKKESIMKNGLIRIVAGLLLAVSLSACQSMYYNSMEKMGVHKRDIMQDRVKDARNSQEDAKEEFKTTLQLFSEVVTIKSGDLEKTYNKLNKAYENADASATEVRDRIASIESVSKALFKEWRAENKTYSNPEFRRNSEAQLRDAEARYETMIDAMKQAARKMDPVLVAFHDQVLFLKHNLNSAAIASIQGEVVKIQNDVSRLISDMEKSIAEADVFLKNWKTSGS